MKKKYWIYWATTLVIFLIPFVMYQYSKQPKPHSITIYWQPGISSTPESYNIYRSEKPGGPYTILQAGLDETKYKDKNVEAGKDYYYVTKAVNTWTGIQSPFSEEIHVAIPTD